MYLWTLPAAYVVVYALFLRRALRNSRMVIASTSVVILLFLKNVLTPVLIVLAGPSYTGIRYISLSLESIQLAVLLSAYELIGAGIFLFLVSIRFRRPNESTVYDDLKLRGNKTIYALFIVASFVLYIIYGRRNKVISFMAFSLSGEGYTPLESTQLLLIRQIVVVSVAIAFVIVVNACKERYKDTHNPAYVNIAIFAAIINIGIIVGDRRSVQIYVGILSVLILSRTFKAKRLRILLFTLLTMLVVIGSMTLYRLGAQSQGSYAKTLSTLDTNVEYIANYLQVSMYGPDAVATSLTFFDAVNLGIEQLAFDFGRTFFGISFLLKGNRFSTSQLYNLYLYNGKQLTGQLVASTSYSYNFFGFVGTPLIVILNILIAIILEKCLREARSYEAVYLFGYCLLRVAPGVLANTSTLLSVVTLQLGTFGLLFYVASLFRHKPKSRLMYRIHPPRGVGQGSRG